MEKVIYDFYSELFESHVHLLPCHLRKDGYVIPSVFPSEVRHAIKSVKNRTAPGPDRIRPEHLKNLLAALVNTLARLFTRYLSERNVPSQWKTSRTVLGEGGPAGRRQLSPYLPTMKDSQFSERTRFRKGFCTIDHIHTITRRTEVSREYKMPLCLTFIDLRKAFDTAETEAVLEALGNQSVST
ncbi:hypothetical protein ANCCEY_13382 [Ancylostoma ceylanicum]|uniref:Reverse transcriptase domain-containing protein n=1 Tax=Ancylostoma ceylanicum TaxID=53326 RepID=A0A0D6LCG2_9BILA|nr:hypothetical protein ANCCEY_13382 [Ancylostoma ceylanicum]